MTTVSGRAFGAQAADELMLGWRAARNLGKQVGDSLEVDHTVFRIVGIYSTGQALGDTGTMFPLIPFQAGQRQAGELTLLFVRVAAGGDVSVLRAQIGADNPQLVTVRTASDFGRADRSLSLINATDRGSGILAILVGAVIVMTTMTITFIERTREFGVLAAIGWLPSQVGLVFQLHNLLPHLSAAQNVELAMFGQRSHRRERHERAYRLLADVDLAGYEARPPTRLSGGERQRVAIARALANDPPLLPATDDLVSAERPTHHLQLRADPATRVRGHRQHPTQVAITRPGRRTLVSTLHHLQNLIRAEPGRAHPHPLLIA